MASIPPSGAIRLTARLIARHPLVVMKVTAPVLVLGAEKDGVLTVGEVRRTGHAYRTEAEIFPGMGHAMMLDIGWQQVADRVDTWVQGLPKP